MDGIALTVDFGSAKDDPTAVGLLSFSVISLDFPTASEFAPLRHDVRYPALIEAITLRGRIVCFACRKLRRNFVVWKLLLLFLYIYWWAGL